MAQGKEDGGGRGESEFRGRGKGSLRWLAL